jgi:hypothetical protein
VVGAALLEAATEVAAEATVAESTHSIQLHPAKSKRASWANPTVGPASSVHVRPVVEEFAHSFVPGPGYG